MRKYLRTHPWIDFSKNHLNEAPFTIWMLLGKAEAKCRQVASAPLRPDLAKELLKIYLAKGIMATTAIEGNTLSEEEVMQHLEGKLELSPSKKYLKQEIDNVLQVCNSMCDPKTGIFAKEKPSPISFDDIKNYNAMILKDLELEEEVTPGKIRNHSVAVGRYLAPPAEDCEYLLAEFCDWLNNDRNFQSVEGFEISFGILKAIIAHLYFTWIHPFGDGNGRTARILEFRILLESSVALPSSHLLSDFYNKTRTEYYRILDRSTNVKKGGVISFIEYALNGFVDSLGEQLKLIRLEHFDVAFRNFIHESFRNKKGDANTRRRHLALDLSKKEEFIPLSSVPDISPRLTKAYANKTNKTVSRDVKLLEEMDLVERSERGVRSKKERIFSFLPPCYNRPQII